MNTVLNGIDYGGYNDFPPGWKRISADTFGSLVTRCNITKHEFRQMYHTGSRDPATEAKLLFLADNTGVAVVAAYRLSRIAGKYKWFTTFYRFGCDHKFETLPSSGRCLHEYRCTVCGYRQVVDSSD